jgi:hypothetical protein
MKIYRPNENTRFHVDYAWFETQGVDVNVLIRKVLTPEQQERLDENAESVVFDYIDETTAMVHAENQVVHTIRTESAKDPAFISARTPVWEGAFRIFLLNGNQPLTALELSQLLKRKPTEIVNQLGGRVIYNGVRPIFD